MTAVAARDPLTSWHPVTFMTAVALAACGASEPPAEVPRLERAALALKAVPWNSREVALGAVHAVADRGDDVVVLSDQGAFYFTNGLLTGQDPALSALQAAAVLPAAAAGSDDWVVGVDGQGRLRWLRGPGVSEDASLRYGVPQDLRALRNLGRGRAAFASADALWIVDAQAQRPLRFPEPPAADAPLSGAAGRAVLVGADQIHVYDLDQSAGPAGRRYPLPGVLSAAIDESTGGKLVAATARALYREDATGALRLIFTPREPAELRALVESPAGVWVQSTDGLAQLQGDRLLSTPAGSLPADARLFGSPSGDLWVLEVRAGGALTRLAQEGAGVDQELWKRLVLPVYTRTCSQCHLRGGAQIDLSSYSAWDSRRALLEQRVLQGQPTPMPPVGANALTPSELSDLQRWLTPAL